MTEHGRPVAEMTEADLEALLDDRLAHVNEKLAEVLEKVEAVNNSIKALSG